MRVLMTADTVGGVWTYALELVRALAAHNVTVALATMGAPLSEEQTAEAHGLQNLEIYQSHYKLEWMDDPWPDVQQAGQWLLDLEQVVQPDIVHLNGYAHGALPWSTAVVVVGHSCVLSWWQAVKGEATPSSWNRYRDEVRRGLGAADLVVAPTQAMLDELNRWYAPLPASRVISNGRNGTNFVAGAKEPFVLAAGRLWDEAKNIGALEAVAHGLAWPVYVAGEHRHPNGGQMQPQHVQMLGRLSQPDLAARMAAASIYALPARYEPFGLSALEAGLSSCALVLGDIPSLREVWGDAAIFVAPDDHRALEQTLTELISDAPRRLLLATRARARAMQYSAVCMAREYFNAYQMLTSQATSRSSAAVST